MTKQYVRPHWKNTLHDLHIFLLFFNSMSCSWYCSCHLRSFIPSCLKIVENIKRIHFPMLDKVSHLPTDTPLLMQNAIRFGNNLTLFLQVLIYRNPMFVCFSLVIWRGGHNIMGCEYWTRFIALCNLLLSQSTATSVPFPRLRLGEAGMLRYLPRRSTSETNGTRGCHSVPYTDSRAGPAKRRSGQGRHQEPVFRLAPDRGRCRGCGNGRD